MKSNVRLTVNPSTGTVFTANESLGKDGKVYGYLCLEQELVDMSSAVANVKKRTAVKSISLEAYNKAKEFLKPGMELSGNIVVVESLEKKPGSQVKRAGSAENAPVCTYNNLPIYRRTEYVDDLSVVDTLIQHTNGAEIKSFQAATQAVALNS